MKTIGLIGGMSWQSSLEYYRILNETVKDSLGGFHSCECIIYSVDFAEFERLQHEGSWDRVDELMIAAAKRLEAGGSDMVLIGTNTMHKSAEAVSREINIPLLHIGDTSADKIREFGYSKVGLLGTRFTMEEDFYRVRLLEKHGIEVVIPNEEERAFVHGVIYNELVMGNIEQASKLRFIEIINNMVNAGAQGIILGCTEIPLLIKQEDIEVKLFDTTRIHAEAAVELALKGMD
jgi:aspartate racemase